MNDLELYIRERQYWKRLRRKKQQLESENKDKDRENNGVRLGLEEE